MKEIYLPYRQQIRKISINNPKKEKLLWKRH